jgi:hypothetical protein
MVKGSSTIPAEKIRMDATCHAFRLFIPSFIKMKDEPQITERITKMPQFRSGRGWVLSIKVKDSIWYSRGKAAG